MTTIKSIKAKVARITRLDECGAAVIGARSTLVTDGFVNIGVDPSYDEGETFEQKNAWGDWCVKDQDDARLNEIGLSIEFCAIHVDAMEMTTGARLLGASLGVAVNEDAITERWALEAWSKVPGICDGGEQLWLYWLFPHIGKGRLGGWSLENSTMTMTVDAVTKAGVADVWAEAVPEPYAVSYLPADTEILAGDHFAVAPTIVAPPAVTAGAVALA